MHLISCEVLRPELESIFSGLSEKPQVHYLKQGLHDKPDELRVCLQDKITELENQGVKKIILGYCLCGKGVTGVHAKKATLVMPKTHDCIPLLLGCNQEKMEFLSQNGSTFWLSPGWLRFSQIDFIRNREKRRNEYESLYGNDNAQFLLEQESLWLAHYTNACLIKWKNIPEWNEIEKDALYVANDVKLPLRIIEGDDSYLKELVLGGLSDRFIQLFPGQTIDMDINGNLISVGVEDECTY